MKLPLLIKSIGYFKHKFHHYFYTDTKVAKWLLKSMKNK